MSREAVTEAKDLHVPRECKGSGLHKSTGTALKQGLGISHICWQNLAEVSRHRAKSLLMPREHKG